MSTPESSAAGNDRPANFCTLLEVADGEVVGIIDVSLVEDGHTYGLTDGGTRLHVEGTQLAPPAYRSDGNRE